MELKSIYISTFKASYVAMPAPRCFTIPLASSLPIAGSPTWRPSQHHFGINGYQVSKIH